MGQTFTSGVGDLGEGAVAAVALAADDSGAALALSGLRVTWSGEGADGVTVAGQTGLRASRVVVELLRRERGDKNTDGYKILWDFDVFDTDPVCYRFTSLRLLSTFLQLYLNSTKTEPGTNMNIV